MKPRRRTRVRVVLQMESAECGVACVSMVLDHFGCSLSLSAVRGACGTSRDGNSALDLLRGARSLGLEGKGVQLGASALTRLDVPAILHWEGNHFVLLEGARHGRVTIVDPAVGRRELSLAEVERAFSGVALVLAPGPAFARQARRSPGYERYRMALGRAQSSLLFVVIAIAVRHLFALSFPAANQVLIDHVILPQRHEWIAPVLLVMAAIAVGQVLLSQLLGIGQNALNAALSLELTTELGRKMMALPLPFLESRSRGDLLERVQQQADLQELVARVAQAAFDALFVLFLATLMLAYDVRLGALTLAFLTLRLVAVALARSITAERAAAELAARGKEQSALAEITSLPEMIKGLGLEHRLLARYADCVQARLHANTLSVLLVQRLSAALAVLGGIMEGALLFGGGMRTISGNISLGVFAGFLAIRAMVEVPLASLVELFQSLARFRGALERSDDVLSVPTAPTAHYRPAQFWGRIECRNLGFRYGSTGPWLFRHVDFEIEVGQHVAIVGPSGQGKSTLVRLLCGLLEPSEGGVFIDGVPVGDYDPRALARHRGVVLQEPLVLAGPLSDALSLRKPEARREEVLRASQLACFDEVVQRLPNGYGEVQTANAMSLSGGERQRLSLAQALVGSPEILILDEATSALDVETERRVLDNLSSLRATVVSVAHRRAAIAWADAVFRVSDGSVERVERTTSDFPPWQQSGELAARDLQ